MLYNCDSLLAVRDIINRDDSNIINVNEKFFEYNNDKSK